MSFEVNQDAKMHIGCYSLVSISRNLVRWPTVLNWG